MFKMFKMFKNISNDRFKLSVISGISIIFGGTIGTVIAYDNHKPYPQLS